VDEVRVRRWKNPMWKDEEFCREPMVKRNDLCRQEERDDRGMLYPTKNHSSCHEWKEGNPRKAYAVKHVGAEKREGV
jgi:hypothetical protein